MLAGGACVRRDATNVVDASRSCECHRVVVSCAPEMLTAPRYYGAAEGSDRLARIGNSKSVGPGVARTKIDQAIFTTTFFPFFLFIYFFLFFCFCPDPKANFPLSLSLLSLCCCSYFYLARFWSLWLFRDTALLLMQRFLFLFFFIEKGHCVIRLQMTSVCCFLVVAKIIQIFFSFQTRYSPPLLYFTRSVTMPIGVIIIIATMRNVKNKSKQKKKDLITTKIELNQGIMLGLQSQPCPTGYKCLNNCRRDQHSRNSFSFFFFFFLQTITIEKHSQSQ